MKRMIMHTGYYPKRKPKKHFLVVFYEMPTECPAQKTKTSAETGKVYTEPTHLCGRKRRERLVTLCKPSSTDTLEGSLYQTGQTYAT